MPRIDLPDSPLYDPKSTVLKFRHEEDFATLRYNLKGTGQVYTDTKFSYFIADSVEWKRPKELCENPKLVAGHPSRFDALQGYLGDCWFVAGMDAITLNGKLMKHVVPNDQDFRQNYIGAFHFRIWQLGFWYDVVVDDRLPIDKRTKKLCYAYSMSGDVFWAALLEKAYVKLCSMYGDVTYDSLDQGRGMTSLQDLTGGIVEMINSGDLDSKDLKWILNEAYTNKAFILGLCKKTGQGLYDKHTYPITMVCNTRADDQAYHGLFLVRLMNPWGNTEWVGDWSDADIEHWKQIDRDIRKFLHVQRDEGEFWMNEVDMARYFNYVYVCHLGPGQYLSRLKSDKTVNKWKTTVFSGEWILGGLAGGSALKTRNENPQYRIHLDFPESDPNKDGDCTVIIELIQRSKYGRKYKSRIAFFIYPLLPDEENIPIPLDREYISKHNPIDKQPDFFSGIGRNFIEKMDLFCPGKYCIIPCTQYRHVEAQFLLRVFSENKVQMWEYDTEISKSLPTEEKEGQDFDERLKALFHTVAQGQDEIDWIGLQEILETEMNRESNFFGIISSLVKFIGNIFGNMFTRSSSNDNGDSDVVFSKDECRSMIAMVDDNHSGKISFSEFIKLWNKILFWTKVYENHKDETEGHVTAARLRDALGSIGYVVNRRTVHSLIYVYANEKGNISLTDFILCGVYIDNVLSLREQKRLAGENEITFTLEEWVKNTLIL